MQTFEFDPNAFMPENQDAADKTLLVKFEYRPKQDSAETLKEGRPIFKDVLYIDIRAPGDRLGGICRPASQRDIDRFPEHYRRFMARTSDDTEKLVGTPLAEWPMVTRAQVEELAFLNVKTVEQLAEVADVHGARIMGINGLKEKAKNWLKVAKDNAAAMQLTEELKVRDLQIAQLQEQVEVLAKKLEERPEKIVELPGADLNADAVIDFTESIRSEMEAMIEAQMSEMRKKLEATTQPAVETKPAKRKPGRPKVKKPETE